MFKFALACTAVASFSHFSNFSKFVEAQNTLKALKNYSTPFLLYCHFFFHNIAIKKLSLTHLMLNDVIKLLEEN